MNNKYCDVCWYFCETPIYSRMFFCLDKKTRALWKNEYGNPHYKKSKKNTIAKKL